MELFDELALGDPAHAARDMATPQARTDSLAVARESIVKSNRAAPEDLTEFAIRALKV